MDIFVAVAILSVIAYLTWTTYQTNRKAYANFPPGAPSLPIVGHLPFLSSNPHNKFIEWWHKYGPTICVRVGTKTSIVIHDFETAKTVLSDENTTGRDPNFILCQLLSKGILSAEGARWRKIRKFAFSTLRQLGVKKSWLTDEILLEVQELLKIYTAQNGQLYNPQPHLSLSITNVICALCFGRRFDHDNKDVLRLAGLILELTCLVEKAVPIQLFPFLKYIPCEPSRAYKTILTRYHDLNNFIRSLVAASRKEAADNAVPKEERNNFIDFYNLEASKPQEDPNIVLDEEQLIAILWSVFGAGTDTTTTTMLWSMLHMAENPHIQAKVHKELDSLIDRSRLVQMEDKDSLVYTNAVLLECQRHASVVALNVPHSNFEPMVIDGFDIPARTVISTSIYAIHRDPKYWRNAVGFHPENFLSEDGSEIVIPKAFMSFSVGKRICPGADLAGLSLFLFFTNIMHKFVLKPDSNHPISTENYTPSFIRMPDAFKFCMIPREESVPESA